MRWQVGISRFLATGVCAAMLALAGTAQNNPWMNARLSPDRRADLVIQQMTLEEKVQLLHGSMPEMWQEQGLPGPIPGALAGDGFVPGISRLGIPDLELNGGGIGVTDLGRRENGQSTALPSSLADTATWDPDMERESGSVIGAEARKQGFNVSLGGGINLTREPRDGRNFEYHGEDPLLAGVMTGAELKAIQAQGIIATIKHYAVNDQESERGLLSANLDKRSMRETDLLAFEIEIEHSHAGAVMCSTNRVNSVYACENKYLLTDVLKREWGFKGWVMSDWGSTHSTVDSALAGLDQEFPQNKYFSAPLKTAVLSGEVPMSRLDDMVHRILRTMFAVGIIDHPPVIAPVDFHAGAVVAQRVEEQGCVLLKNNNHLLPLDATKIHSIAVIGSHANLGVLAGSGSAQVEPQGGNAIPLHPQKWQSPVWDPSPPLLAIAARAHHANILYDDGEDSATAAQLAKTAEIAIVFVNQFTHEGADLSTLKLPDNQDELVRQVSAANPHTVIVAETGGAFLMPWIDQVGAVLESWYPGIRGGQAITNILFGDVNPSGKLPITFPNSDADLPHPELAGLTAGNGKDHPVLAGPSSGEGKDHPSVLDVNYTEGLKVGYKWFDAENKQPLFPFGFGLSYTTFSYGRLHITCNKKIIVTFSLKNTGTRIGAEIAQIYLGFPRGAAEPPKRLVGWQKVQLRPGETRFVSITLPTRMMAIFDVKKDTWEIPPGEFRIYVGSSSRQLPLQSTFYIQVVR